MKSLRLRLVRLCALVGIAGCVAAAHVAPVGADESRSGQYDLYRNGARVGSESWNWRLEPSGIAVLTMQCAVEIEGVSTTIHPTLRVDGGSLTPISYEFERAQGDQVSRIRSEFDAGRVTQHIEANGMTSKKQLKIKPSDLVVNDDVVSQFLVVAERYDFEKGDEQEFTVFDVKTGRSYVARAMVRGLGTVENGLGKFRVRRLSLTLEDQVVDLYIDTHGRVPQIDIPMRGIEARMPGYRGDEKLESTGSTTSPTLGLRVPGR